MIKNIDNKIENAKYRLSEINSWISNFDSKASFLLAYMGILIGFLGTNGVPKVFSPKFENITAINVGLLQLFVVMLYFTALVSLILLILSLLARINTREMQVDSFIYFGHISKKDYENYEEKILKEDEEELLKDILHQSYINSIIATRKAKCYNYSIIMTVIATVLFLLLTMIGVL